MIKPQHRLYASFFLFALITGAFYSRLPDLQQALAINEAQLGLTLIGAAIGSLISLTFASPLIARLGARTTAFITVIGSTAFYVSVAFIHWAPLAFAALFAAGLLVGALELNINLEVGRLEVLQGRSLMSRAHGFWSLGFFVTSLLAAAIRQLAIPAPWHLGVAELIIVAAAVAILWDMTDTPHAEAESAERPPLVAFPTLGLLPLCLMGVAAFLIEGAGVDWSTIYMRDAFSAAPFIGGLGLTFFTFFMSLARLFAGPFIDRWSPRVVVGVMLVISAIGLVAVWLAPHPYVALLGFALLGAGCSSVYPIAVSAAAQRGDRAASVNVAAIGQVTFVIFFLAPPILGFVAHHFGIRLSYLVCLPLVIASLFVINALPARAKPAVPGEIVPEPLAPNG